MKLHVLFISIALCFVSCAHKSGPHGVNSHAEQNYTISKTADPASRTSRQLDVYISDAHGERKKLEGSKIFEKYKTAVFMVYTSDGRNSYQGSGFFINSEGLAVSNYHVFKGTFIDAEVIKLPYDDHYYKVTKVIHSDEDNDFIIFIVNISNTNYIPLANFKPEIGDKVYAIGSPHGLENTFSSGEVSQWRGKELMQTSVQIDHGSSGGALINEYGEVVGITSGTFCDGSQANLNYAWSIDVVKQYVNCKIVEQSQNKSNGKTVIYVFVVVLLIFIGICCIRKIVRMKK